MSNHKNHKYFLYHTELPIVPSDLNFIEITKIKKIKKAKEILIMDLLDFIEINQKIQICKNIYECLDDEGVLSIQGVDAYSLSSALLNNQIDIQTFNNFLFYPAKKDITTMGNIIALIKESGFMLLEAKFINGIQYSIKCGKNR